MCEVVTLKNESICCVDASEMVDLKWWRWRNGSGNGDGDDGWYQNAHSKIADNAFVFIPKCVKYSMRYLVHNNCAAIYIVQYLSRGVVKLNS